MSSTRSERPREMSPAERSLASRAICITLGFLFLLGGIVGYLVPGLPGTPLLLVAAWLFSMSSERLNTWMTTNRWFGKAISDYRPGLGLSRRSKLFAIGSMIVVVPVSVVYGTTSWLLQLAIVALALIGSGFVLTRPTRDLVLERT